MEKPTILVVGDETTVAKDLAAKLKSSGYSVPAIADSGEEAIRKAEEIRPDLVLMDTVLRGRIDGLTAAEQIRSRLSIPVVYVGADLDDKTTQQTGDYLTKPLQERELLAAIEMALYKHQTENKLSEFKQWFVDKLRSLNEALMAMESKTGLRFKKDFAEDTTHVEARKKIQGWVSQVFPADTELFRQGSRAREVYFLEKGMVKLICQETDGKQIITALPHPGSFLGTPSVILDAALPFTAVTLTRCRLRRIASTDFSTLLKTDADLSWSLHQMFASEIYSQMARSTGIECLPARRRLEELLWQLASNIESPEVGQPVKVQFPAKHAEIAQFLAITPQYLSWLIGQLEKKGVVRRHKGWLLISESEKLWHRTDLYETSFLSDPKICRVGS